MTKLVLLPFIICFALTLPGYSTDASKENIILEGGEYLEGLLGSHITALAFDQDSVLWIGSFCSGIIAHYDGQFKLFDRLNTNIPDNQISEIFVDKDNTKWFGTTHGYVFTYDNVKFEVLPRPGKAWSIVNILQDHTGLIWVEARDGGLWCYKNKKIVKHFTKELSNDYLEGLAIDSKNNIWVGTKGDGIDKYDGEKWENINKGVLKNWLIWDAFYDSRDSTLYLMTGNGLHIYKEGNFRILTTENSGLPSSRGYSVRVDSKGNLWVGCNSYSGVTRFDGQRWIDFNKGTPLEKDHINDLIWDADGRIWFGGIFSGLTMFDGESWIIYPILTRDPRIWWRQKKLQELFMQETTPTDIRLVLDNPVQYRGKKIKVFGKIKTDMVGEDGNRLRIWPEKNRELKRLLKNTGIDIEIEKSELKEYVGYLESKGCYGEHGSWRFQLFIVEIYPYPIDDQQKAFYKETYKNYLDSLERNRTEIRDVVNQWISAMKSDDIEKLRNVLHTENAEYRFVFDEELRQMMKRHYLDTSIEDISIGVDGEKATAYVRRAAARPLGNLYRKIQDIVALEQIHLKKDGIVWKILDIDRGLISEELRDSYLSKKEILQKRKAADYINPLKTQE